MEVEPKEEKEYVNWILYLIPFFIVLVSYLWLENNDAVTFFNLILVSLIIFSYGGIVFFFFKRN